MDRRAFNEGFKFQLHGFDVEIVNDLGSQAHDGNIHHINAQLLQERSNPQNLACPPLLRCGDHSKIQNLSHLLRLQQTQFASGDPLITINDSIASLKEILNQLQAVRAGIMTTRKRQEQCVGDVRDLEDGLAAVRQDMQTAKSEEQEWIRRWEQYSRE
ncbi:MAG: hypothetical protein Q9162_007924 [Coniocarpon cinnabarinum]